MILADAFYFLLEIFSPYTFKVITDIFGLNLFFYLSRLFLFLHFSFFKLSFELIVFIIPFYSLVSRLLYIYDYLKATLEITTCIFYVVESFLN